MKKKYPGGHITLYYGSQTGTAETFAKDIEREGEENGFKMEVIDLEDIEDDILASVLKEQKKLRQIRIRRVRRSHPMARLGGWAILTRSSQLKIKDGVLSVI